MAVRYYYVIARLWSSEHWCYLGKTSDLVFKVEPDVSIDCDDGQTVVGSEKLSCTMTLLEEITDPLNLDMLRLVPVDGREHIIIKVKANDYKFEVKSGEFAKTVLSVSMRYAADGNVPYNIWHDSDTECVILGRVLDIEEIMQVDLSIQAEYQVDGKLEKAEHALDSDVIDGNFAFVIPGSFATAKLTIADKVVHLIEEAVGVHYVEIMAELED